MQILIAVINNPEKIDEILSGFIELGITGATIHVDKGYHAMGAPSDLLHQAEQGQ